MLAEPRFTLRIILRCCNAEKAVQRYLRVHNHIPSARKAHEHVRTKAAFLRVHRNLFRKITMRRHPGELDGTAEGQFTPSALDLGLFQSAHQRAGFPLEVAIGCSELLDLIAQLAIG